MRFTFFILLLSVPLLAGCERSEQEPHVQKEHGRKAHGQNEYGQKGQLKAPYFVLCGVFCTVVDSQGKPVSSERLFKEVVQVRAGLLVHKKNFISYGAMSLDGEIILKPVYDELRIASNKPYLVGDWNEDVAGFQSYERVLTANGRIVINCLNGRVGVWHGHPWYRDCKNKKQQGYVFTNSQGKPIAQFVDFDIYADELALASKDGKTWGYVGPDLTFRIAPQFLQAEEFYPGESFAKVTTAEGVGVIDRQGNDVIEPGSYQDVDLSADALFIQFQRPGDQHDHLVARDGTPVDLPDGLVPVIDFYTRRHGYRLVKGPGGVGAVNADGQLIVPAQYAHLNSLTHDYLAFAKTPYSYYGLMNRHGEVVIEPAYRGFKKGPGDSFWAEMKNGWVLVDAHNGRLGERVFSQVDDLSFHNKNEMPLHLVWKNGQTGAINGKGELVVPLLSGVVNIEGLGHNLWRVKQKTDEGKRTRVYDASGAVVQALEKFKNIQIFNHGLARASLKMDGTPVVITPDGEVVASYKALFPQYTREARGNRPELSAALDRCYVLDPTIPVKRRIQPSQATQTICAHPELRRLSRQVEIHFGQAVFGSYQPRPIMKLHQAYAKQMAACSDVTCLRHTMQGIGRRIEAKREQLVQQHEQRVRWPEKRVPKSDRVAILSVLAEEARSLEVEAQVKLETDEAGALWLASVKLSGKSAVMVYHNIDSPDHQFWLLAQGKKGEWRMILSDLIGSPRHIVAVGEHNGWPVLRINSRGVNVGIFEYYRYEQVGYDYRYSCERYRYTPNDADGAKVMFCGSWLSRTAERLRGGLD